MCGFAVFIVCSVKTDLLADLRVVYHSNVVGEENCSGALVFTFRGGKAYDLPLFLRQFLNSDLNDIVSVYCEWKGKRKGLEERIQGKEMTDMAEGERKDTIITYNVDVFAVYTFDIISFAA